MSQVSQELAETYGEARVRRARTFLQQRQEEVELFQKRIEDAQTILHELAPMDPRYRDRGIHRQIPTQPPAG